MSKTIRVGNHFMRPDAHCWIVGEIKVRETGANAGQEYEANVKYPGSVSAALHALLERHMRESDAESVAELRAALDDFKAQIASLFKFRVEA